MDQNAGRTLKIWHRHKRKQTLACCSMLRVPKTRTQISRHSFWGHRYLNSLPGLQQGNGFSSLCEVCRAKLDKISRHYETCQLLEMVFVRPLLDSMHSHGVTVSAFSGRWKARAALRKLKRDNNQQKAFGESGNSWDLQPGLFMSYNDSPVTCMLLLPTYARWTSYAVNFSLLKGVKLILVNFLTVKTAFWCMLNSQTTRLHFGGAAFNVPQRATSYHGWIVWWTAGKLWWKCIL